VGQLRDDQPTNAEDDQQDQIEFGQQLHGFPLSTGIRNGSEDRRQHRTLIALRTEFAQHIPRVNECFISLKGGPLRSVVGMRASGRHLR
jgi:hypothetical protein